MTDHPGLSEQRANVEGVLRVVQRSTGDQAITDAADTLESLAAFAQPPASGVDREALEKIARLYDDWDPEGEYPSNVLFRASRIAKEALTNSGAPVPGDVMSKDLEKAIYHADYVAFDNEFHGEGMSWALAAHIAKTVIAAIAANPAPGDAGGQIAAWMLAEGSKLHAAGHTTLGTAWQLIGQAVARGDYLAHAAPAPSDEAGVPDDVVRLVIAARMVAWEDPDPETLKELQAASELFASRVPWEDEPEDGA